MAPPPHTANHLHLSKAQMHLFKILHIISSFPSNDVTHINCLRQDNEVTCESLAFDVDLNSSFHPPSDIEPFVTPTAASSKNDGVFEKNEQQSENSEISHVEDQSSGIHSIQSEEQDDDEGLLGLLLEAAEFVEKPAKRKCWTAATEAEWYAEFEDTSPVVRSKRGRNQVLPYKYRDSVVEPLVRMSQPPLKRMSIRRS